MIQRIRNNKLGFTLIELAIVLAISGVLVAGLWRLLSGGNQQLRDQAAANSQAQLIAAIKSYLTDPEGQGLLKTNNTGPIPTAFTLVLPASVANAAGTTTCAANLTANPHLCNYLPPGFWSGTTNSYGQTYTIHALGNGQGTVALPVVPNTYSFMIMTVPGDPIPDTSGGRIVSMIGGDGGFIYSNPTGVCPSSAPVPADVCGAYGAWYSTTGTYGFGSTAGTIASRTYVVPEQDSGLPWLARGLQPSDVPTPHTPLYNTMTTDLFLGGKTFYLGSNSTAGVTIGGGNINFQSGALFGTANIDPTNGVTFQMPAASINGLTISGDMTTAGANPALSVQGGCTTIGPPTNATNFPPMNVSCLPSFQVVGDANVFGLLNAYSLFAGTFIYKGSDMRLKTNIHPITNSLSDIMKLKPVSYTLKADGQKSLGVIAQDLEKVYPQLVRSHQGTMYVDYDGLVAPLVGAVQELKEENDQLRQEIKAQAIQQQKLQQELENQHSAQ